MVSPLQILLTVDMRQRCLCGYLNLSWWCNTFTISPFDPTFGREHWTPSTNRCEENTVSDVRCCWSGLMWLSSPLHGQTELRYGQALICKGLVGDCTLLLTLNIVTIGRGWNIAVVYNPALIASKVRKLHWYIWLFFKKSLY